MDNENKWEYDYSSLYHSSGNGNDTGYANVGSSGTNAANQYDANGGGNPPPVTPDYRPVPNPEEPPRKPRRGRAGRHCLLWMKECCSLRRSPRPIRCVTCCMIGPWR